MGFALYSEAIKKKYLVLVGKLFTSKHKFYSFIEFTRPLAFLRKLYLNYLRLSVFIC
jgi:hypothetical protein